MLQRLEPSFGKKKRRIEPDPRQQMENARHLSKYVFPRQYGLSNPFIIVAERKFETFELPDFTDREAEIKVGDCSYLGVEVFGTDVLRRNWVRAKPRRDLNLY